MVDKPAGITTHPNTYENPSKTLVKILEKQVGHSVYSVHRLDRPACGIMLLAGNRSAAAELSGIILRKEAVKIYLALVRGFILEEGLIDVPLKGKHKIEKGEARTRYTPLCRTVVPEPVGKYDTARYTLVELVLETGRYQQARRHLQCIDHPIVGDKLHGDRDHNRYFASRFREERLFLRSYRLVFKHPLYKDKTVSACAGIPGPWLEVFNVIGITLPPAYPLTGEASLV